MKFKLINWVVLALVVNSCGYSQIYKKELSFDGKCVDENPCYNHLLDSELNKQIIVNYNDCADMDACFNHLLNSEFFIDAIPNQKLVLMSELPVDFKVKNFSIRDSTNVKLESYLTGTMPPPNVQTKYKISANSDRAKNKKFGDDVNTWALSFIKAIKLLSLSKLDLKSKPLISVLDNGVDWKHPYLNKQLMYNTDDPYSYYNIDSLNSTSLIHLINKSEASQESKETRVLRRKLDFCKDCSAERIEAIIQSDDDKNGYPDDLQGWSFYDNSNDTSASKDKSHGMEMLGIISANNLNAYNESKPPFGLSKYSRHLIVKLETSKIMSAWRFLKAVSYSLNKGVKIINYSAEFPLNCSPENCINGLDYAHTQFCKHLNSMLIEKKAVLVASAPISRNNLDVQNQIPESRVFPSACNKIKNFSKTKLNDIQTLTISEHMVIVTNLVRPSEYGSNGGYSIQQGNSSTGKQSIQIAAPGEHVFTLNHSQSEYGNTRTSKGTSAAAALMTGGIALLMSTEKFSSCSAPEIAQVILDNATICSCFVEKWEKGRIMNLEKAYHSNGDGSSPCNSQVKESETDSCSEHGNQCIYTRKPLD